MFILYNKEMWGWLTLEAVLAAFLASAALLLEAVVFSRAGFSILSPWLTFLLASARSFSSTIFPFVETVCACAKASGHSFCMTASGKCREAGQEAQFLFYSSLNLIISIITDNNTGTNIIKTVLRAELLRDQENLQACTSQTASFCKIK